MTEPVLFRWYRDLPARQSGENAAHFGPRFQAGLDRFQSQVKARYTEGTLQRLLHAAAGELRQAAVLALGLLGSMRANESLARRLHDADPEVRRLAADALWFLWFRDGTPEQNRELQRLMRLNLEELGPELILAGFEALLRQAPRFAEAYNQRAILCFRTGDLPLAIADCHTVLRLNPFHFGAAGGLAQCYMRQRKLHAALRAYRRAFRINPNLDGIPEVIQSLEQMLGKGRK